MLANEFHCMTQVEGNRLTLQAANRVLCAGPNGGFPNLGYLRPSPQFQGFVNLLATSIAPSLAAFYNSTLGIPWSEAILSIDEYRAEPGTAPELTDVDRLRIVRDAEAVCSFARETPCKKTVDHKHEYPRIYHPAGRFEESGRRFDFVVPDLMRHPDLPENLIPDLGKLCATSYYHGRREDRDIVQIGIKRRAYLARNSNFARANETGFCQPDHFVQDSDGTVLRVPGHRDRGRCSYIQDESGRIVARIPY